ncbi:protein kinase domain-containing protein [Archangium lansingense]|uniref:Protein kinase n=1 Tax=Archangium lansingense TaxID=2995310 RepID=A0ABT3ZYQ4_9BACT|nr:protein kinase [Archangium lansinium]MCY1074530.1 protein kinase [Archangium lansinium]
MIPIPLTEPALSPRRFGQYMLLRKLAEGGMAEIFLAKRLGAEGFERDVVIKCMLDHFTQNQDFISMFLDEARLAARLHHPNIVQISDLGIVDGRYFICMEYLAGGDLESILRLARHTGEPVPIPIAARIMLSVLEGLEFAHGYQEQGQPVGLVHRDISPSNIFVTFQGTVKVLDFGIAKASSRMTQTQPGLLKGKWGYMSPEQARGEAIDARSDLFSLGITFHELLTGRRVFELNNEIGVLLALMAQPIPSPSTRRAEIPPALDRIVMKALERQADDRYSSAAAMRADLEEFLRSTPSVPGMSQLGQYMRGLFGQAEVERKTKIPSLTELAVPLPLQAPAEERIGFEKTLVRGTGGGEAQPLAEPSRPLTEVPTSPAAVVPRSTGRPVVIGALTGLVLLGLGGGAAWYWLPRTPAPAPLVVVAPPAPAPEPAVESPMPVAAATPAPAEAQPPEPATPDPDEAQVQTPSARPKAPVLLTSRAVNRVLMKYHGKVLDCGKTHLLDLPADRRVLLKLTVKNSGEVRSAQVSEPAGLAPDLARCLESRVEQVRFPRNTNDPEFQIVVPMRFTDG